MPVRRSSFSFGFNQVALENHWTFPGLTQPLKGGKLHARQGFRTARKDPCKVNHSRRTNEMWRSKAIVSFSLGLQFILAGCGGGGYGTGNTVGSSGSGGGSGSSSGGMSISSISPNSVTAGSAYITLTVAGTNLDLVHSGSQQTHTFMVWVANGSQTRFSAGNNSRLWSPPLS